MSRASSRVVGLAVLATVAALVAPLSPASAVTAAPKPTPIATTQLTIPSGRVSATRLPDRPVTRLIVRTTDGTVASAAVRTAAAASLGVGGAPVLRRMASGSTLVGLSSPVTLAQAWRTARALTARADVVYAEPDVWLYPSDVSPVTPADTYFAQQWDLWDSTRATGGFSSRAPAAWSRTTGKPAVVVAVLDTGLTAHPDLTSSVATPAPSDPVVAGYDFVSANSPAETGQPAPVFWTANDGDGRDSNPSDPGDWITASEDAGTDSTGFFAGCGGENPDGSSDSSWHGTHVTGTIVARQDNGVGISGIAPGVKVQPVRVLGKCGGYMSDIADGVTWASGGHVGGVPDNTTAATVISMSLGGPGVCATTLTDAISGARSRGTTVVVAAGNGDANGNGVSIEPSATDPVNTGSEPADCAGVVVVGATDRTGHAARYSNLGTAKHPITIAAPGGAGAATQAQVPDDILSTVNLGTQGPTTGTYAYYAGTSMATPHVAAAVALLQSQLPTRLTPDAVAARLAETARPNASLPGCTVAKCGAGLLDIGAALATAPAPPSTVDASPADSSVDLAWSVSAPRGSAVTGYHVEGRIGAGPWQDVVATTASIATSLHVTAFADTTALANGTTYTFRVSAINGVGESTPTAGGPVTPNASPAPDRPEAPSVTGGLERLDPITWVAPSSSGPITDYSVRYRLVGAGGWSCVAGTAPDCLTGSLATTAGLRPWPMPMAAGTYEVQVAAVNASGRGLYSPSGTAAVTALVQRAATSAGLLRPFRDGFQDSVRLTATSNTPASGSIRIVNAAGAAVLVVPLTTRTSWSYTWTGVNSRRARVPNGVYRAVVLLTGRSGTTTQVASLRILVASSQAGRPSIAVTSSTVYPYVDRYLDSIRITTTAGVPATYSWKLLRGRTTVWNATFTRRYTATTTFAGKGNRRVALPAGTYRLVVVAKGGEGVATTSSRNLTISAKRLHSQRFTLDHAAAASAPVAMNGTLELAGAGALYVQGGQLVRFAPALPSSVKGYTSVVVETCTEFGGEPLARVYLQYMNSTTTVTGPSQGPLGNGAGYCYYNASVAAQAPASSIWLGRVHFALGNLATTPDAYYVSAFRIVGTRYYLS